MDLAKIRKCPYCAETIKAEAKICRFCGRDLVDRKSERPAKKNNFWVLMVFLGALVGLFFVCTITGLLLTPSRDTRPAVPATPAGPTSTPVIWTFSDRGDGVINITFATAGLAHFSFSHQGEANFIVTLRSVTGGDDLLVNEIGDYDGQVTGRVSPGDYVLQIEADGSWGAAISPP